MVISLFYPLQIIILNANNISARPWTIKKPNEVVEGVQYKLHIWIASPSAPAMIGKTPTVKPNFVPLENVLKERLL